MLPGVTNDGETTSTRWRDGLIFGVLVVVGAFVAVVLSRAPRPRDTPALRRALYAAGAVAVVAVVVGGVFAAGSFTSSSPVESGSGRYTSAGSNFRWEWWQQAWHGWAGHRLAGTGAGSFHVTNLRYRGSFLDETTEPHSLPLQFLSEAGRRRPRAAAPRGRRAPASRVAAARSRARAGACSCPRSSSIR